MTAAVNRSSGNSSQRVLGSGSRSIGVDRWRLRPPRATGRRAVAWVGAFSPKRDESEGLSAGEVAAVTDWRRTIAGIALEEMGHLGLVSNLFCALGLQPHFGRQNFPVAPGYHPADIIVRLAPFDMETIQHFVFLERPDRIKNADGKTYARHHK